MSIGPMVALHRDNGYNTRADARRTILLGGAMTVFFLILTCLVVLGTLPESASSVPILTAIQMMNNPRLILIYRVCLLFALVSSNGPGLYAMAGRWALQFKKPADFKVRVFVCSLGLMGLSMALSTFGLMNLIAKGWAYMGTIGIFVYGLPSFTAGLIKSRKDNKKPELPTESQHK